MASTICTVSFSGSLSVGSTKTTIFSHPSCSCSSSTNSCLKFPLSSQFSQLGVFHFSPWNGLKHMGISISAKPQKIGRRTKYRGKVVYASLFGVGAPEALVIGVVALLVFGPKGLAEVAKNLGKTLRAFQPTIKELQEVSREFKSTLEREISLDDDPIQARNTFEQKMENYTSNLSVSTPDKSQTVPLTDPNGATSNNAYSTEDYLKITEEQLKVQQEAMSPPSVTQLQHETPPEALQQNDMSSPPESQIEPQIQAQAMQQDVSSPPENSTEPESQPQDAQKTTAATVVQRPESES
ncbi:unnamed protein product [Amaranthus hypochondriacus]